ncbi:DUF2946 domain-containing protein [Pseudomonas fluorescens]|uniref:Lipoprotein n=1 Tax=Pseudomonas fluorescens TaxID=294 RepID=A0A5E6T9I9_PSEFL|nr:DUF2946 domain-containing protein [Pseudomonas fluorescens]VVM89961.1 hypothetical protein PS624_02759 [Pseudomonas fluorescens]
MNRHLLAIAWFTCLAVMFNMLTMPITGTMAPAANSPTEQCPLLRLSTGIASKTADKTPDPNSQNTPPSTTHLNTQQTSLSPGSAPLVALPAHSPQLYFARYESNRSVAPASLQTPTPRQQWPSLNPRASPLV